MKIIQFKPENSVYRRTCPEDMILYALVRTKKDITYICEICEGRRTITDNIEKIIETLRNTHTPRNINPLHNCIFECEIIADFETLEELEESNPEFFI